MARIPIGLQMYTLRDDAGADFEGTLERVAQMGYDGVEMAGYGGKTASELKALLDSLGLKCAGAHEGIENFENDFNKVIDFHKELGNTFVTVPFLNPERWDKDGGWEALGSQLNEIGAKVKAEGLQLCYHNHSFEFKKFSDKYGLDILYSNSEPENLMAELDTYWVKHGGEDPVAYIKKYDKRIPLVHLKDMTDDAEPTFAEVGEGILDIEGIFTAAEEAGAVWMIVEQDVCKRPPLESVKISIDNIKKMQLA